MTRTAGPWCLLVVPTVLLVACGGGGGGGSSTESGPPPGGGFKVTYDPNGATTGAAPTDSTSYQTGASVAAAGKGTLGYPGYQFLGWQTQADGTGTTYAPGQTFSMGSADVTLHAVWAWGYAYVTNHTAGLSAVSQFAVRPDGALAPMATPFVVTGGNNAQPIAVDPSGRYVYVANVSSNTISQFTVGATGGLAAMTPPTVATSTYPLSLAVDPAGKHLYVANNQVWSVSAYTIGADGKLTAAGTVSAGGWPNAPSSVAVAPDGKNLYVANGVDNSLSQFAIDQASGDLTPEVTVSTGGSNKTASHVAVEPAGKWAYVTNYFDGTIAQFRLDPTTGAPSALSPLTVAQPVSGYAAAIVTDPSGAWAYVGGTSLSAVRYTIGADGKLGAPVTFTSGLGGVAAIATVRETSGDYAYLVGGSSAPSWGVAQFKINGITGALEPLANATVRLASPAGIAVMKVPP